jgi:hypothetical protein
MPYCEKHYNQLFAQNCAKCSKPINGQVFEALDQKFHLDCFVCEVGPHKIGEAASFHVYQEKVYCPQHFEELFLQRCAECGKVIQGQYVKILDSHFHPECWKCHGCSKNINSGDCAQQGGKFYCKTCFTTLPPSATSTPLLPVSAPPMQLSTSSSVSPTSAKPMPTNKPPSVPSEPQSLAQAIKSNPLAQKGGLAGANIQAKPGILERQSSFLKAKEEQQNKAPVVLAMEEKKRREKRSKNFITIRVRVFYIFFFEEWAIPTRIRSNYSRAIFIR